MKILWLTLIFINLSVVIAGEERALGKSPRGLLIGDAFTALADDEYSLFYNPALLGRHSGFTFHPFNPTVTGTNVLSDQSRFEDLGDDPGDIADAMLGFPIHVGANFAPGFKMGNFGLVALMNSQSNLNLQNKVSPTLDVDFRNDRGFIAGFGAPIQGSYTQLGGGTQLSLGVSVKYIDRESINGAYYLLGTTLMDAVGAEDPTQILNELGKVRGQGWGFDLGVDYIKSNGGTTFSAGLAFLDVVTNLQTEDNENDYEVQSQPMQVNFGTSYAQKLGEAIGYTLSVDIKRLSENVEFMRRVHLGGEVNLTPALSVLAGMNALDNYSYGLKLNMGLVKAYAGFYGVETGESLGQEDSDRFLVYLSLFEFNFMP
ncbi:MAG: hypothetical protein CME62_18045 [Halobacteriovoraceae bacterium]|nr:hypothetical protein [Halobacteriovoraceae bacterium]|tara:strand:+ start:3585 stop:4700 length:1116 start_codon:yes stop_codon:yes gene_type:complete